MQTFHNLYIFRQDCLIKELKSALLDCGIKFDNSLFEAQANKIVICLLLIFNDSDYKLKKKNDNLNLEYARCYITTKKKKEDLYLSVSISIKILPFPEFSLVSILDTDLKASEWCDNSLKIIKTSGINREPYIGYDLAKPLIADDNFILHAL